MSDFLLALDSAYGLLFLVAGVLAALDSYRDLRIAKTLVILGAAILAVRWSAWAVTTDFGWGIRALVGAIVGALLFALVPAVIGWINHRSQQPAHAVPKANGATSAPHTASAKPWKHTLEELYASDFSDLGSTQRVLEAIVSDPSHDLQPTKIQIRFRLYQDFRSGTDFVSVFIPASHDARIREKIYGIIVSMRDQIQTVRDDLRKSVGIGMQAPGIPYTEAKDLKFSGRVFVYTDEPFNVVQMGDLTRLYQDAGLLLQIRGLDYWTANKDR